MHFIQNAIASDVWARPPVPFRAISAACVITAKHTRQQDQADSRRVVSASIPPLADSLVHQLPAIGVFAPAADFMTPHRAFHGHERGGNHVNRN